MMEGTYLCTCLCHDHLNLFTVYVHVSVDGIFYFLTKFHTRFAGGRRDIDLCLHFFDLIVCVILSPAGY
jgi:hypothetical protein